MDVTVLPAFNFSCTSMSSSGFMLQASKTVTFSLPAGLTARWRPSGAGRTHPAGIGSKDPVDVSTSTIFLSFPVSACHRPRLPLT